MKKDKVYPYYLLYLEGKLLDGSLSKGAYGLLKISSDSFNDYKYRFDNDGLFHTKQLELHKLETRNKKIDDIFDDIN